MKLMKFAFPTYTANFKNPSIISSRVRARRRKRNRIATRLLTSLTDAKGLFPFSEGLVFCLAGPTYPFVLNFLISGIGRISSGTLTRIKEEPGADDGQRSSLPLGKNQPLQYQGVAATAVSREIRQRRCGSCAKKKKKIKRWITTALINARTI